MESLASVPAAKVCANCFVENLNENIMATERFGHQFLTINSINYSGCLRHSPKTQTFAAQNLNLRIFPKRSSAGLVRSPRGSTDVSEKGSEHNAHRGGVILTGVDSHLAARRVVTRTMSPGLIPSFANVPRKSDGSDASSTVAPRDIEPVCRMLKNRRPVGKDERILVIGRLVRRQQFRRDQLGHPVRRRKALVEHHITASCRAHRSGCVILALYALPTKCCRGESEGSPFHLKPLAHVLVVPFLAHALGQILDDPQVLDVSRPAAAGLCDPSAPGDWGLVTVPSFSAQAIKGRITSA